MPELPPVEIRFRADTSHFRSVVEIIAHHFQALADDLADSEEDPMLLPGARETDPQAEADRLGASRLLGKPDAHFCHCAGACQCSPGGTISGELGGAFATSHFCRCGGKCPCSEEPAAQAPPERSLGTIRLSGWEDEWDAETVVPNGMNPLTRTIVKLRPPAKAPTAAAFADLEKRFFAYCAAAWDLGRIDPEEITLMGGKTLYMDPSEPTDAWPGGA